MPRPNIGSIGIHNAERLEARAYRGIDDQSITWLQIGAVGDGETLSVSFFLPYELALAYADALNSVAAP